MVSNVEAIAAVSAHRTLREVLIFAPLPDDDAEVGGVDEPLFCSAFSRANLSERDSYWDCKSCKKRGPPDSELEGALLLLLPLPPPVNPDPDAGEVVCEGRLRLAPVRGLAALFAADVIVSVYYYCLNSCCFIRMSLTSLAAAAAAPAAAMVWVLGVRYLVICRF